MNRVSFAPLAASVLACTPVATATVTSGTLFGDSYIVVDAGRTYSVLDVYIRCGNANDIISSVFGVTSYPSAFTVNQGDCLQHSNAGSSACWDPACGQTAWDSFVTCGSRDQCTAKTALSLVRDTNWSGGTNCCAIESILGGAGWFPSVGSSTSINPYARGGAYNGQTTAVNTAKTTRTIDGNGVVPGQSLDSHWMVGRFTIDITAVPVNDLRTMTLKFAIAGKQNGTTTFTGATSAAGRFNFTLAFDTQRPSACPSDLDGTRTIDFSDVSYLLMDFGPCSQCAADLDGSGTVDFSDVALMLLDFGDCS